MTLKEEVAHLREENAQLKEQLRLALEQLAQALARIQGLQAKLDQLGQAESFPSICGSSFRLICARNRRCSSSMVAVRNREADRDCH
jgi:hypothetical protein